MEQELWFGFDGHGSTRVLMDVAGAIAQLFAYDAYGQAIGFNPADALTEFLYSGEQFDAKIGQQYLRARYYDPATGTFNRLDPFFGNLNDPQSLHNYLYCHADPVTYTDPNGKFIGTLLGLLLGGFGAFSARSGWDKAAIAAGELAVSRAVFDVAVTGLIRFVGGYAIGTSLYFLGSRTSSFFGPQPLWIKDTIGPNSMTSQRDYADNIFKALKEILTTKYEGVNTWDIERELQVARAIADAYANVVLCQDTSGSGWVGNATGSGIKCSQWYLIIDGDTDLKNAIKQSHWVMRLHENVQKHSLPNDYWPIPMDGEFGAPINALHCFVSLTFDPNKGKSSTPEYGMPDLILDPWVSGKPDMYDPEDYNSFWPLK